MCAARVAIQQVVLLFTRLAGYCIIEAIESSLGFRSKEMLDWSERERTAPIAVTRRDKSLGDDCYTVAPRLFEFYTRRSLNERTMVESDDCCSV